MTPIPRFRASLLEAVSATEQPLFGLRILLASEGFLFDDTPPLLRRAAHAHERHLHNILRILNILDALFPDLPNAEPYHPNPFILPTATIPAENLDDMKNARGYVDAAIAHFTSDSTAVRHAIIPGIPTPK